MLINPLNSSQTKLKQNKIIVESRNIAYSGFQNRSQDRRLEMKRPKYEFQFS